MFETAQMTVSQATPESLWQVLSKVDEWPRWNPGYRASVVVEGLVRGATGKVTLANGVVRPFRVWDADAPTYLRYGTVDFGNEVSFTYRFERAPGGGTTVTIGSSIRGWLSPVLGRLFGRVIAGYLPEELSRLVHAAEDASLIAAR